MPLTKIKSLGITDGTITGDDINSTFNLTGKTVTLPSGTGGKVLQVITATDSTSRSTTSTSFVTGSNTLSVSITPSSASNKILILVSTSGRILDELYYTIYRGATDLGAASNKGLLVMNGENGVAACGAGAGISYLDSPATTSSTTYQVYFRVTSGTGYLNYSNSKGSITVFEIAG